MPKKKRKENFEISGDYHLLNDKCKIDLLKEMSSIETIAIFKQFAVLIHEKYPYLSIDEISAICKESIYSLRDLLLLGNVVSIPPCFSMARLSFVNFYSDLLKKRMNSIKVKCNTSKKLKWSVDEFVKEMLKESSK